MVRRCVIEGCSGGYVKSKFHGFTFPSKSQPDLALKWIKFTGKLNWFPTEHCMICFEHFEERVIQRHKTRWQLKWNLSPVPVKSPPSYFKSRPLKRKASNILTEETTENVNFKDLRNDHGPSGFSFKREDEHVIYYNLSFHIETGFPSILECIKVTKDLHVQLQYKGRPVPLPDWFVNGTRAKLRRYEELHELSTSIRSNAESYNESLLEEMFERVYLKPKGRPPYTAAIMRFALLLRHTSLQAYRMLLTKFPFPSISLLQKIQQGGVDPIKSLKKLRENHMISSHIVLMVDEMYVQKGSQYQAGSYVGLSENGELYKGVVVFMVVGLQKSIPFVVQALPEVRISGQWLAEKISDCITLLGEAGFLVRAVCADNHSSNVNSFKRLKKKYNGENYSIVHPANNQKRTFLLFDTVHILKNIRNNLLACKKFVFPSFQFEFPYLKIYCPAGFIGWADLHALYEKDLKQQANLKKAHKLSYSVLHPGNNKQSVPLALAVFHESTIAAAKSYLPSRKDFAGFLCVINAWWSISNSKQRFHANPLGNSIITGDMKLQFLQHFANWIEKWCTSPNFTLTSQTAHAIVGTVRGQIELIKELLTNDGFGYVLTSRLQSDPVERRISQYRQMSGGRFLVSLKDVINTERILACRAMLKQGISFWKEGEELRPNLDDISEKESSVLLILRSQSSEIMDCYLIDSSAEVSTTIAGYISKKLKKRMECENCNHLLISSENDLQHDSYLKLLSRGGLTVPSPALAQYTNSCFAIIDFASQTLQQHNITEVHNILHNLLKEFAPKSKFTCDSHEALGQNHCHKIIINIFYNNLQKISSDSLRKDSINSFKKRQLEK